MYLKRSNGGITQQLQPNIKDLNTNILLFLNQQKLKHKQSPFPSIIPIIDAFFNILTNVSSLTHQFTSPISKAKLTNTQIITSKLSLEQDIDLFLLSLRETSSNVSTVQYNLLKNSSCSIPTVKPVKRLFEDTKDDNTNTTINSNFNKSILSNKDIVDKIMNKTKKKNARTLSFTIGSRNPEKEVLTVKTYQEKAPKEESPIKCIRKEVRKPIITIARNESYNSEYGLMSQSVHNLNNSLRESGNDKSIKNGQIKQSTQATKFIAQYHNVIDDYNSLKTIETLRNKSYSDKKKKRQPPL